MFQKVDELDLGERRGSYPVAGLSGFFAQLARRGIMAFYIAIVIVLLVDRPPDMLTRGAAMSAVLVGLIGYLLAWRRLTARLGLRRCYLYTDGVVVTNWFGRVQDCVSWRNVRELDGLSAQSLVFSFHRLELWRRDRGKPLRLVALGMNPKLTYALYDEAKRNGVRC